MKALRRVLGGTVYVSDKMTSVMVRQSVTGARPTLALPIDRLTDRELEVFELIGRGRSTREIAEALHLSPKTVETHCAHIKEELGLVNHIELLRHATSWQAGDRKSRAGLRPQTLDRWPAAHYDTAPETAALA